MCVCVCVCSIIAVMQVAQPIWTSSQNPNRLAIPAQGIADIRNSLAEIVDEFGTDEGMNMSEY